MGISVTELHARVQRERVLPLAYTNDKPLEEQRAAMEEVFRALTNPPEKCTEPKPIVEFEKTDDPRFDEIRFTFESEPDFFVPAHMLLPKNRSGKLPVVICLQGHSTGMHISLGRAKFPGDDELISGGDRDFAIQAVARGYAAIAMEQRGFGELKSPIAPEANCFHPVMQAFELGRTMAGERASDISRLIDALAGFDMLDLLFETTSAFSTTGLSSAGTANLSPASQWLLLPLMYLGRVGPLTLGLALASRMERGRSAKVHYPEEKIMIG